MMTFANNFTGQEHNFDCKAIYIWNNNHVLFEITNLYTNAPRCFLSPGGMMALTISRVLRLVCQAANNKFPLSVCFNHKSMFSVLDRLKINLNQVAVYSSGGLRLRLRWREVEGGELPSARDGLRAAMVGDVLHVTGGVYGLTTISAWDPVTESWQDVGDLNVKKACHAAVALPDSTIKCPWIQ